MNPFVLRRLKTVVLRDLPAKSINVVLCEMTTRQKSDYANIQEQFNKLKAEYYANRALLANQDKVTGKENEPVNIIEDGQKRKRIIDKSRQDLWIDSEDGEQEPPEPTSFQFHDESSREMCLDDFGKTESHFQNKKQKSAFSFGFFMSSIMSFRKAANHPLLRRVLFTDEKVREMAAIIMKQSDADTRFDYVVEDMSIMNDFELSDLCSVYKGLDKYRLDDEEILTSGKFQQLDKLLDEFKKVGDRVLIFSQFQIMLNILERYLEIRKHKFLRLDGNTNVADRQGLIDKFNENKDILVFMLTTKAG